MNKEKEWVYFLKPAVHAPDNKQPRTGYKARVVRMREILKRRELNLRPTEFAKHFKNSCFSG